MARLTVTLPDGDRTVENPRPAEVETAIQSLDGDGEVHLGDPTEVFLGIAGGPHLFFVGYGRPNEGLMLQARSASPPESGLEVMIGGQRTTLEPQYLVPLEVASAAMRHFLATEEPSPTVGWDRM